MTIGNIVYSQSYTPNNVFFADEVPEAEEFCKEKNLFFVAGFYSSELEPYTSRLNCKIKNSVFINNKFHLIFGTSE